MFARYKSGGGEVLLTSRYNFHDFFKNFFGTWYYFYIRGKVKLIVVGYTHENEFLLFM